MEQVNICAPLMVRLGYLWSFHYYITLSENKIQPMAANLAVSFNYWHYSCSWRFSIDDNQFKEYSLRENEIIKNPFILVLFCSPTIYSCLLLPSICFFICFRTPKCSAPLGTCYNHLPRVNKGHHKRDLVNSQSAEDCSELPRTSAKSENPNSYK